MINVKTMSAVLVAASIAATATTSTAGGIGGLFDGKGGVIGDITNVFVPGAGTILDEAHRGFKHANPKYGKAEEALTNRVRKDLGLKPHCEPLYNKYGEQVACY